MKKTGELDFMKKIWSIKFGSIEDNGRCEECDIPIKFAPAHCCHILSKGSRPDLRLVEENIVILCFNHHQQLDFGDKKSLKIWDRLEATILNFKNSDIFNSNSNFDLLRATMYLLKHKIIISEKQDLFSIANDLYKRKK